MLHRLDPLRDARWRDFVIRHPHASVFHTPDWLEALRRTYRYEPVAFTDAASDEAVKSAIVFCRVKSWLTGERLVSVPFSDHSAPLLATAADSALFLRTLESVRERTRYLEIRASEGLAVPDNWRRTETFCTHEIDLRPDAASIFGRFHRTSIRQVIKKADATGMTCECGNAEPLLREFYALHMQTRQKHQMPVQPIAWFRNVLEEFGERARIYVAHYDGKPAAALFMLTHGTSLVYKYGCSNVELNRLGATPWLIWRAIQDGKAAGLQRLDLGRSDGDNPGLITFKDHLGGVRSELHYYRFEGRPAQRAGRRSQFSHGHLARRAFAAVPTSWQMSIGSRLYRHFG